MMPTVLGSSLIQAVGSGKFSTIAASNSSWPHRTRKSSIQRGILFNSNKQQPKTLLTPNSYLGSNLQVHLQRISTRDALKSAANSTPLQPPPPVPQYQSDIGNQSQSIFVKKGSNPHTKNISSYRTTSPHLSTRQLVTPPTLALSSQLISYPKVKGSSYDNSIQSFTQNSIPALKSGSPIVSIQMLKTKICSDFQNKRCVRGENCPYAHGEEEIRHLPDLTKTKMCVMHIAGKCHQKECKFAHSKEELRYTCQFPQYKTDLCRFHIAKGGRGCKYGEKCPYAHDESELRTLPTNFPFPHDLLEKSTSNTCSECSIEINEKQLAPHHPFSNTKFLTLSHDEAFPTLPKSKNTNFKCISTEESSKIKHLSSYNISQKQVKCNQNNHNDSLSASKEELLANVKESTLFDPLGTLLSDNESTGMQTLKEDYLQQTNSSDDNKGFITIKQIKDLDSFKLQAKQTQNIHDDLDENEMEYSTINGITQSTLFSNLPSTSIAAWSPQCTNSNEYLFSTTPTTIESEHSEEEDLNINSLPLVKASPSKLHENFPKNFSSRNKRTISLSPSQNNTKAKNTTLSFSFVDASSTPVSSSPISSSPSSPILNPKSSKLNIFPDNGLTLENESISTENKGLNEMMSRNSLNITARQLCASESSNQKNSTLGQDNKLIHLYECHNDINSCLNSSSYNKLNQSDDKIAFNNKADTDNINKFNFDLDINFLANELKAAIASNDPIHILKLINTMLSSQNNFGCLNSTSIPPVSVPGENLSIKREDNEATPVISNGNISFENIIPSESHFKIHRNIFSKPVELSNVKEQDFTQNEGPTIPDYSSYNVSYTDSHIMPSDNEKLEKPLKIDDLPYLTNYEAHTTQLMNVEALDTPIHPILAVNNHINPTHIPYTNEKVQAKQDILHSYILPSDYSNKSKFDCTNIRPPPGFDLHLNDQNMTDVSFKLSYSQSHFLAERAPKQTLTATPGKTSRTYSTSDKQNLTPIRTSNNSNTNSAYLNYKPILLEQPILSSRKNIYPSERFTFRTPK